MKLRIKMRPTLRDSSPTFALLFLIAVQYAASDDAYRAAVVEYACAVKTDGQSSESFVQANANKMVGVIGLAKEHAADIVVFPELGTMCDEAYFVAVPDPKDKIIPADNSSCAEVLKIVSKAARTSAIYVVINVLENYTSTDGTNLHYNTNVAFDRNGTVIARYRKYNLYGEYTLNATETPEHVVFDTDFGVRFGIFICFDIDFEQPAIDMVRDDKVTHFVYSAAWYSELPFLTSIQIQNAFSYGNDVILLASGLNNISVGHTGSGIYRGKQGRALTWFGNKDGTTLIVGNVPKLVGSSANYSQDVIIEIDTKHETNLSLWQENMTNYATKLISPEFNEYNASVEIEIDGELQAVNRTFVIGDRFCNGVLCCSFNMTMVNTYVPIEQQTTNYLYYRMAISNGLRSYSAPGRLTGQQVCGVISCLDGVNATSCAKQMTGAVTQPEVVDSKLGTLYLNSTEFISIDISGDFISTNVFATISTLNLPEDEEGDQVGELVNVSNVAFNSRNDSLQNFMTVSLNISDNGNRLVSGGIFVRTYDKDTSLNGTGTLKNSLFLLLLVAFYFGYN